MGIPSKPSRFASLKSSRLGSTRSVPGVATKLSIVTFERVERGNRSSESTLIDRRLASWKLMRKRETRIDVSLRGDVL